MRGCRLPLDDAIVIQLSLGCQHDGVLLLGDLKQSGLGEPFCDVTDHSWQQLFGGDSRQGTNCVFHCLRRNKRPRNIQK